MDPLENIWDMLWKDYTSFNPHALKVYDLILEREKKRGYLSDHLINDHVAFRTFRDSKIGLESLARIFMNMGYECKNDYHFEQKKLYAKHFEHKTDVTQPKIFISELLTEEFSTEVQAVARAVSESLPSNLISRPEFLWSGRTWDVSHKTYLKLLEESEYAAWMYAFGFRPNHFTVSVNDLRSFDGLKELNEFLKANGISLNSSGGEIKGSESDHLEQSSTLAGKVTVGFEEGSFEIPACYYEFARRYEDADGKLYTGFVAKSADKIFESTDVRQQK